MLQLVQSHQRVNATSGQIESVNVSTLVLKGMSVTNVRIFEQTNATFRVVSIFYFGRAMILLKI